MTIIAVVYVMSSLHAHLPCRTSLAKRGSVHYWKEKEEEERLVNRSDKKLR